MTRFLMAQKLPNQIFLFFASWYELFDKSQIDIATGRISRINLTNYLVASNIVDLKKLKKRITAPSLILHKMTRPSMRFIPT